MKYLSVFLLIGLVCAGNGNKGTKGGQGGQAGPVNSCQKQSECLNTNFRRVEGNEQDVEYEICVWWDSHLSNCRKGETDSISHVCNGEQQQDKTDGLKSGEKICRTVSCGTYASFGFKDGSECAANELDGSYISAYAFSDVSGIICKAGTQGGMCGGGSKTDCVWMIPAPKCDNTLTYTTQTPDVNTTTSTATTSCVRQAPEGDVCAKQNDMDACDGFYESAPDGCIWRDSSCVRACGYYGVGVDCSDTCGCQPLVEECMPQTVMLSASNAAMRDDEYVSGNEFGNIETDQAGEWINGVRNMYLFVGVGVIGFTVIMLICLLILKLKRKNKYVEMEENGNMQSEIQMNEIEVDELNRNTLSQQL